MKIAVITPTKYLDEYAGKGDIHLVLAQLVHKSRKYAEYYKHDYHYKIIDNGAFEGEAMPIDKVVDAALAIDAGELILPDVPFEMESTIRATLDGLDYLQAKKLLSRFHLMAVPQGKNIYEYLFCLERFLKMPEINVIGLSKLSVPVVMKNELTPARLVLTKLLKYIYGSKINSKEWHCLGGSNRVLEEVLQQEDFIRSLDTSAPYFYAKLHQKLTDPEIFNTKTVIDFNDDKMSTHDKETMQYNIVKLLEVAHGCKS